LRAGCTGDTDVHEKKYNYSTSNASRQATKLLFTYND
jgi:hypothetical protein